MTDVYMYLDVGGPCSYSHDCAESSIPRSFGRCQAQQMDHEIDRSVGRLAVTTYLVVSQLLVGTS